LALAVFSASLRRTFGIVREISASAPFIVILADPLAAAAVTLLAALATSFGS
jgi:hypothetical protein